MLTRSQLSRSVMVLACFIGLFASGYLLYTYVTGADIACAIVSGCDVIRASEWAYTYGIPRPFLGLVFYAGVIGLLILRSATMWRKKLLYRLTVLAAIIAFIESGFLFVIQWLDVKAFCFWCLLSALASVLLIAAAPFDKPEDDQEIASMRELKRYFLSLLIYFPIALIGFILLIRTRG